MSHRLKPECKEVGACKGKWRGINLTYSFIDTKQHEWSEKEKAKVSDAFLSWSNLTILNFKEKSEAGNIKLSVVSRSHGDSFPFDGRGGKLAHAFFPSSQRPGEIHYDQADFPEYLFAVTLHEIGHAVGLVHSDNKNSVMYPYIGAYTRLDKETINRTDNLYTHDPDIINLGDIEDEQRQNVHDECC